MSLQLQLPLLPALGSDCLLPSTLHCHLLTNGCKLPRSTYVRKGSPELKSDDRQEGEPTSFISLPLPFQYSYITLQVFPLAQSLAALLEQSGHHNSFTFPGTKPSCVTVVCPYSVRSPAALELCLIRIGSFMDRGVPFQSFHPAVL